MKKPFFIVLFLLIASIFSPSQGVAQSTLSPGDIAIIQYRTDSTDGFGFVALVDIAAGTKINFTDNGWGGSALASDETVWTWELTGSIPLTKGTVVTCQGSSCSRGTISSAISGLDNDNGDQVIAFQGTTKAPTFIYALSTTTPWITAGPISNSTSYLPVGLITGVTAIAFSSEIDNGYFNNGDFSSAIVSLTDTKYRILQRINPESNWSRANTNGHPFKDPPFWLFNVTGPFISVSPSIPPYIIPPVLSGVEDDPTDPARTLGIGITISDSSATVTPAKEALSGKPYADPTLELTGAGTARTLKITPKDNTAGYAIITISATDSQDNTDATFLYYAASKAATNPNNARFHTGASDASTVVAIDNDYMFVGNDEDQVIRLYHRNNSGLPPHQFDFNSTLDVTSEVDIEASTRVGNRIYWIGSHGNDRQEGEARPDRNRLFATDISGSGASATLTYMGRYDNLRNELKTWGDTHGYDFTGSMAIGKKPIDIDGFSIEGLTMAPNGTTAYIGLRAPLVPVTNRTKALIVPVTNLSSLIGGMGPAVFGDPIEMDLGGLGIRSIERNTSNQYLIIAGGPGDNTKFQLFTWTGNPKDAPQLRITNPDLFTLNDGQPTGGYEAFLVPDNLNEGSILHLLVDNGRASWYGDTPAIESKKLHANFQKFRRDQVTIGPVFKMSIKLVFDCPSENEVQVGFELPLAGTSAHREYEVFFSTNLITGGWGFLSPALVWRNGFWQTELWPIGGEHGETRAKDCGSPGASSSGYYTACLFTDPDNDGLSTCYEELVTGTDPNNPDSDNDGTNDGNEDSDGDGLTNLQEYNPAPIPTPTATSLVSETALQNNESQSTNFVFNPCRQGHPDPLKADTDGDGVNDGIDTFPLDPSAWFDNDCDGKPDQPLSGASTSHPPLAEDDQFTLTVVLAGSGTGSVKGAVVPETALDTTEFMCPTTCEVPYYDNTQVTLTAVPEPGSVFSGWTGGGCSGTDECTVTISDNQIITANFSAAEREVVNGIVTFIRDRSSYKTTTDTTGCTSGYIGQFSFDATLTNKSDSPSPISGLVVEVAELTNNNVLQNADGGPGGVGSRLIVPCVDGYDDCILKPGESVKVHFIICLTNKNPFRFVVDVLGFKEEGTSLDSAQAQKPFRAHTSRITGKRFFGRFRP